MVAAVRKGTSQHEVARRFDVSLSTVQFWVARAGRQRLDRVDWMDRPRGPRRPANRSAPELEELVVSIRDELRKRSDLGEYGAQAIRDSLRESDIDPLPSLSTINRILDRRGALDASHRVRRPAPPPGWYLPDVASRHTELDSADIVEGLVIRGGIHVEVINVTSLHGGLVASWPNSLITSALTVGSLIEHWREFGLPGYAQFDNDPVFHGPHIHEDSVGHVTRVCLTLGVTPVFAPPRETGFQAAIENFNGRWQAKVWARFIHASLESLQSCSARYVAASRQKAAVRIEAAPPRLSMPEGWHLDLQRQPSGRIVYLRRTDSQGAAEVLGHRFEVHPLWPNRLVRAEVDLDAGHIRFYALRRRQPTLQSLLREVAYRLPHRRRSEG
jgi:putative transposase